ncbi:MAG: DEAD/DEAH box helicase [Anaerorhabdus sp.]
MKTLNFNEINLHPSLQEALSDCGYFSCTSTQAKVIPALLKGGNFLIQAPTGTGKTAAFCTPLINQLQFEETTPTALILAPTRELARQIQHEFNRLGLYRKINCICCVGRESLERQKLQLKQRTHAIVGTPGRIQDLVNQGYIDLSQIKTLILDEATELISLGLLEQVQDLSRSITPEQTWLFSATLENVDQFDFLHLRDAQRIETHPEITNQQIQSFSFEVDDLDDGLLNLLQFVSMESAFIFTNTQQEATNVYQALIRHKYTVSLLHGGLDQKKRNHSLAQFKAGKSRLLVATNVAARGVDVDEVSCVIHYLCPLDWDSYVHRSGRVGRRHFQGKSILLTTFDDPSKVKQQILESCLSLPLPTVPAHNRFHLRLQKEDREQSFKEKNVTLFIRAGKKDKVRSSDIVGALCAIDSIEKEKIGIINIQPSFTTVTLLNTPPTIISSFDQFTLKGKRRKVEIQKLH